MKILVAGGAGFIGSFMVKRLLERKDEVTVIDSLERGHGGLIDDRVKFLQGNILDKEFLTKVFSEGFEAIFHFAAYISMEESMKDPYLYFQNNVLGSLNLIDQSVKTGVGKFIFSSSAGVYGMPSKIPISEDHPKIPANPYGESKLMVENILKWYKQIYNLKYAALRYFNASGASLDGSMGEAHNPETHIVPLAVKAALENKEFVLYGSDYNTKDGTCVRDYIHVLDLVEAHVKVLDGLSQFDELVYNVGTGRGYSNREVIDMVKKISGIDFKVNVLPRRSGDADVLIADSSRMQKDLNFNPQYSSLENIVETAWQWHKKDFNK